VGRGERSLSPLPTPSLYPFSPTHTPPLFVIWFSPRQGRASAGSSRDRRASSFENRSTFMPRHRPLFVGLGAAPLSPPPRWAGSWAALPPFRQVGRVGLDPQIFPRGARQQEIPTWGTGAAGRTRLSRCMRSNPFRAQVRLTCPKRGDEPFAHRVNPNPQASRSRRSSFAPHGRTGAAVLNRSYADLGPDLHPRRTWGPPLFSIPLSTNEVSQSAS
jgi:hypothetical protein